MIEALPPAVWNVRPRDAQAEARLVKELGVPPIVAALLAMRGFHDPEVADRFLNPQFEHLADPRQLPDFDLAAAEILGAIDRGERIYIHGDYDVDGVTSTAIFGRFLQSIGAQVDVHVPHRKRDGYGVRESAVEAALQKGAKLFVTCDCGSGSLAEVEAARERGMRVVITDHHTVGPVHPQAHAFVNPHRRDSVYPFKYLSGAGVVFRLCEGLTREKGLPVERFRDAFLDLATLGTVADVMPLVDENRVLVKFGLERLQVTKKKGLQELFKRAKVDPARGLTASTIGFRLGPRLNAVGRMDDAAVALELLLTKDDAVASRLADELEAHNTQRRASQDAIYREAVEEVLKLDHLPKVLLVAKEGWHQGVVGIVAGKLRERFYRPTFVCYIKNGTVHGSGRSIPEFNLAEAIRAHPQLVEGGGHALAAGLGFQTEDLDRVRAAMEAFAEDRLTDEDLIPKVDVDLEVCPGEVNLAALEHLKRMEPFGTANPEPIFISRRVKLQAITPTANPESFRLRFECEDGSRPQGIVHGMPAAFAATPVNVPYDVLYQPSINEFRGQVSIQWSPKEMRRSDALAEV